MTFNSVEYYGKILKIILGYELVALRLETTLLCLSLFKSYTEEFFVIVKSSVY